LTKAEIKAALQAIENWFESERINIKSAVDAAVGRTVGVALAKELGKIWMQYKWELE